MAAELGEADATLNVDETGFPKKGTKSVGVKRQYSGTLGRTDNCQVGVFMNYRSTKGHTLIDRRLFVPAEWASDAGRREEAGVPAAVVFRTKPQLALEMVQQAMERAVPFGWVTGDSIYGGQPDVRTGGPWSGEVVRGGHVGRCAGVDGRAGGHPGWNQTTGPRPTDDHAPSADQARAGGCGDRGAAGDGLASGGRGRGQSRSADL